MPRAWPDGCMLCPGAWPGSLGKGVARGLEDWACCLGTTGEPCGTPAGNEVFKASAKHHHCSPCARQLLETHFSGSRLAKLLLISQLWPAVLTWSVSQPRRPVLRMGRRVQRGSSQSKPVPPALVREQAVPGDGKESGRVGDLAGKQCHSAHWREGFFYFNDKSIYVCVVI